MKINLHKLFTLLLSIGLTIPLLAQDKTFDDRINDIMEPVTGFLGNLIF